VKILDRAGTQTDHLVIQAVGGRHTDYATKCPRINFKDRKYVDCQVSDMIPL
jgi:hypothetical protein